MSPNLGVQKGACTRKWKGLLNSIVLVAYYNQLYLYNLKMKIVAHFLYEKRN